GNHELLLRLGLIEIQLGHPAQAADAFERCVRLEPRDAEARRYAMGAWQLAGNAKRATELFHDGVRLGVPARALLGSAEAGSSGPTAPEKTVRSASSAPPTTSGSRTRPSPPPTPTPSVSGLPA